MTDAERAEAERFAALVVAGDPTRVAEAVQSARPARLLLALAVLLAESRDGRPPAVSPAVSEPRPGTDAPSGPPEVTEDHGEPRGAAVDT